MGKPDREIKPGPVPADVIKYFGSKGLVPSFSYLDVWNEQHAFAFTFSKAMRHDLLAAMQDSLAQAIADGTPFEAWKKELKPKLQELGWWDKHTVKDPLTGEKTTINPPSRLWRIFDTNLRSARAAAQFERIQRQKKVRPYLLYTLGPSLRHREQHVAWAGTLLPVDDPFWQVAMPPNGYGCLCSVRSVSHAEYEELKETGIQSPTAEPILDDEGNPTGHVKMERIPVRTEAPKLVPIIYTNKRTGQTATGYEGIPPEFAFNPYTARQKALAEAKQKAGT